MDIESLKFTWHLLQKVPAELVLKISQQSQSQLNEGVQLVKDLTKFKHLNFPNEFFLAEASLSAS